MLVWLNFRLEKMFSLNALEKRYYQNKTQLRYNFGTVYIRVNCIPLWQKFKVKIYTAL